jgi:hypothetical protein
MCLLLTLAVACRRREHDRGRLVAVELHGRLRRHDVPARSGCGRFARARAIVAVRYCGALQTRANGWATATATCRSTVPRATTSTAAPRGLSSAGRCPTRSAAWRAGRRSRACAPARRPAALAAAAALPRVLSARPGTSPPTRAARRVITGYPGLVGSVPPTISALTALNVLCVPFARPGSPPTRRLRRSVSAAAARGRHTFGAAACLAWRDQALVQERLYRPDPREHHGAHPAGRAVRRAAARAVSRPTRACRTGTLRRRALGENRFSGSVPPAISALAALTVLCVPFARPGSPPTWCLRRSASAAAARGRFIFGAAARLRCARSGP